MTNITHISDEYRGFLEELKQRIRSAQLQALRKVNRELIALYWDVGRRISEMQERHGWGKAVVETLAGDLQRAHPGIKGFSARNLWYMQKFYSHYKDNEKMQTVSAEIGWSHNVAIMERCKDDEERAFYINLTRTLGLSYRVLINRISNQDYQKRLNSQVNPALIEKYKHQAKLAVKDEYTFDFLELGEEHGERELELGLVRNIERFLLEMGPHFTFVGRQHRLEVDGDEFFVDLLLFHRGLRCLVAVELKTGKFKPDHMGQLLFYQAVLDDKVRLEGEGPTIGLLICKEKNRAVVEYSLQNINRPMGVAAYSEEAAKQALPAVEVIREAVLRGDLGGVENSP